MQPIHWPSKSISPNQYMPMFDKLVCIRSREEVTEITVEDPAPGFSMLRDIYDVKWLMQSLHETHHPIIASNIDSQRRYQVIESVLASLKDMNEMNHLTKLVSEQIRFVLRAWQYHLLQAPSSLHYVQEEDDADDAYRKFRLAVKRQLLKDNIEIKSLEKTEMQKALDEMYSIEEARYIRVQKYFSEVK